MSQEKAINYAFETRMNFYHFFDPEIPELFSTLKPGERIVTTWFYFSY